MRAHTFLNLITSQQIGTSTHSYHVLLPTGVNAWQNENKASLVEHYVPVECL